MEAILPERTALRSLPSPEKQELKWLMPNCLLKGGWDGGHRLIAQEILSRCLGEVKVLP